MIDRVSLDKLADNQLRHIVQENMRKNVEGHLVLSFEEERAERAAYILLQRHVN